ncbi:molybdenum cofactor guanylyltransferase [[Haemophilus] ducreyi]|uniref:molybdenum cofactor guanylyltransferase MobA n=1 Tax=Haemophilus ducreyi TaxID=730 RepID=UPI0007CDB7C1|nr:molybdenum cofactor guanylyltransferase MobA [[Haemophilus] ducreyi]ANF61757.1 molybdenum cofactor guanylyltransferase [[Haemophilus] ducreyi]
MAQISQLSAVILAGGLARRMNGNEKGLCLLHQQPLISHILARLTPQVCTIYLNINRSFATYQQLYPQLTYYSDKIADFQGPLSGILSGFEKIDSEYLLFVPCDTPFLPKNLVTKLTNSLIMNEATIAYAHDGEQAHPTIALIHRSITPTLASYLANGERRLYHFFKTQKSIAVDFSDQKNAFQNFNSLADLEQFNAISATRVDHPRLLGITGYSGTGKTTLLEKLIPILTANGIKVGLIKHSHHNVDIDKNGKDSHRLRTAGANPTIIACQQRWALMTETPQQAVDFQQLITKFDPESVNLILVENFKDEQFAKIQLHRQVIKKPLPELDEWTIATATDYPIARTNLLDINQIDKIADFIQQWLNN